MVSPPAALRSRQRILSVGALAAFGLFVVGASVFVNRIEDDLEQRVPDELAEAGFTGVVAEFSGQDGTLYCSQPLGDPQAALDAAYDVWGVRAVDLDRSCRVNVSPETSVPETEVTEPATVPTAESTAPPEATSPATTTTTTVPVTVGTIGELLANDPQFSLLSVLVVEAGLDAMLTDPADSLTMFAPPDDAFDALGADALEFLRSDQTLLAGVLQHHLVDGQLAAADLEPGELPTRAGDVVVVDIDDDMIRVDDAQLVETDLFAGNGVVHVVDMVLLPDGIELVAAPAFDPVSATLDGETVVLEGTVAGSAQRVALITAIGTSGDVAIDDQLVADPDMGATTDVLEPLIALTEVMVARLDSGSAVFDGAAYAISGAAASADDHDAVVAVAGDVGAVADIIVEEPVEAEPATPSEVAAQLGLDLNEFVRVNPITFEPGSAILSSTAPDALDQLAVMILTIEETTGVVVTVEGHTDSDGDPADNRALSALRAAAVRDALIARGVSDDVLDFVGQGSDFPVVADGVEDKEASRRVEFVVVAVS